MGTGLRAVVTPRRRDAGRTLRHTLVTLSARSRDRILDTVTAGTLGVVGVDVVIEAHEMEKRYGARRVLRGLTFSLPRGGCLLVTGPNGSGKTTLLRLLAGLTAPTRGTLTVDAMRSRLGYLAHEPLLYRELTGLENLELFGRLYRIHERRERIGMLLERFRDLGGARRARRRLLEGHGATAGTLPGAAPRAGAAGPRRAVHRARRTGLPSCSTASSRRSPVRRRSSSPPTTPTAWSRS